jgi:hypothetical protein
VLTMNSLRAVLLNQREAYRKATGVHRSEHGPLNAGRGIPFDRELNGNIRYLPPA